MRIKHGIGCVIIGILLFFINSCTKEPPPPPWEPSSEDTTAIMNLLEENQDIIYSLGFLEKEKVELPGVIEDYVKDNISMERYIPYGFFRNITDSIHKDTMILSPFDTTLEVEIIDSLKGTIEIYIDKVYRKGDSTPTSIDTTFEKSFEAEVWRRAFFERDDEGNWILSKITGGAKMDIPNIQDAPVVFRVILSHSGGKDTIYYRPDTTTYGVERLYSVDSLISVKAGDTVEIESFWTALDPERGFNVIDTTVKYFVIDGKHYIYSDTTKKFVFTEPGLKKIYFEAIIYHVFVYPKESLKASMIAIPIKVVE